MLPFSTTTVFDATHANIPYLGLRINDPAECVGWLSTAVRDRAYDAEEAAEFDKFLHAEGFDTSELYDVLSEADEPISEKDLGEAMAELTLQHQHGAVWFTNRRRDMRSVRASLPGADIVGFVPTKDGGYRLLLAEVKTSSDAKSPPTVMYGDTGLQYQLYKLATDSRILKRLLRYTFSRVKQTQNMPALKDAVKRLDKGLLTKTKLVGVLVRDTTVAEKDVSHHAGLLSTQLPAADNMSLIALYVCVPAKDWSLHCKPL